MSFFFAIERDEMEQECRVRGMRVCDVCESSVLDTAR